MSKTLKLKTRHYRALPIDQAGYAEDVFELPVERTALIGLHCWNVGLPDGPAIDVNYVTGMGWPQATEESWRLMTEVIRPAMDIARRIGMPVCHVEPDDFDKHYPQVPSRRTLENQRRAASLQTQSDRWTIVRTGELQTIEKRSTGVDLAKSPATRMKRAKIVEPMGDEPLVFYTNQPRRLPARARRRDPHLYGLCRGYVHSQFRRRRPPHAAGGLPLYSHAGRHGGRGNARYLSRASGHALWHPPF